MLIDPAALELISQRPHLVGCLGAIPPDPDGERQASGESAVDQSRPRTHHPFFRVFE